MDAHMHRTTLSTHIHNTGANKRGAHNSGYTTTAWLRACRPDREHKYSDLALQLPSWGTESATHPSRRGALCLNGGPTEEDGIRSATESVVERRVSMQAGLLRTLSRALIPSFFRARCHRSHPQRAPRAPRHLLRVALCKLHRPSSESVPRLSLSYGKKSFLAWLLTRIGATCKARRGGAGSGDPGARRPGVRSM